jgi:hypothetical protein
MPAHLAVLSLTVDAIGAKADADHLFRAIPFRGVCPRKDVDVLERHYPAYLPLVGPTRELLERTFAPCADGGTMTGHDEDRSPNPHAETTRMHVTHRRRARPQRDDRGALQASRGSPATA